MKKILLKLLTGGLVFAVGINTASAQDDDDSTSPLEIYTCSYADGKGAADLDKVVAKWNKWADDQGMTDYSAWTMTPFFPALSRNSMSFGWAQRRPAKAWAPRRICGLRMAERSRTNLTASFPVIRTR